ncbi:type II secretion system protein N [Acinetobacter shaoyimingii]|uniref:Type II secretion system protein N n=1 Tax=Acinetobacter shaoyimingii TaxID=2715164 RepID=A0A6G8RZ11_9GAMM|nr:type II secretion system protein N [Acinetobacter shaoyimingii]QIO07104.1 type II secretion system protein N [Acinetobacter shaoyimingii]
MNVKSKQMMWWGGAIVALLVFIVLQIPASWLISKFYKNNQILKNVSGNIWQGQADWQQGNLRGSVTWKTRPLDLLLLRIGAHLDINSGKTQLNGIAGYSLGKKIIIKDIQGQIAPESLRSVVSWQWPTNNIQVSNTSFSLHREKGFSDASGEIRWAGGPLIYEFSQRQERMDIPQLDGNISDDNGKLLIALTDQRGQKMANLSLESNMMLDVQLTQRLLQNVASYTGKAGLDTYVVSSRQPLMRGGF